MRLSFVIAVSISLFLVGEARATRILPAVVDNRTDHPVCRIPGARSPKDGVSYLWQKSAALTPVLDAKSPAECIAPKSSKQIASRRWRRRTTGTPSTYQTIYACTR